MASAYCGVCRIGNLPDPYVPSVEMPCSECGEPCWLSIDFRAQVTQIEGALPPLICEVCMPVVLARLAE